MILVTSRDYADSAHSDKFCGFGGSGDWPNLPSPNFHRAEFAGKKSFRGRSWLMFGWLLFGWLLFSWLLFGWLLFGWLLFGWLLFSWLLFGWLLFSWLLFGLLLFGLLLFVLLLFSWLLFGLLLFTRSTKIPNISPDSQESPGSILSPDLPEFAAVPDQCVAVWKLHWGGLRRRWL